MDTRSIDAAAELSPSLNQDTVFSHVISSNHHLPSQLTPLDQPSSLTPPTPPSRSPSPLSLSAFLRHEGDGFAEPLATSIPLDRDTFHRSYYSDCSSECTTSDSGSLHSCASPFAMNVTTVRANLAAKGLYYDDEDALARNGQEIIDMAHEIITYQRPSPTSKENAPLLKEAIRRYCGSTERTLVFNIWHILRQKDLREVVTEPLSPPQDGEALAWVKRAWSRDFLDCVFEADLSKEIIPDTSHTNSETTDIMFKDLPRIEQPCPDVTYGLWRNDISGALRNIFDLYHCELAKDVFLPFFVVEVKTENATLGEAENQCIRGGASLVNGRHQWNRVAAGKTHSLDLSKKEKEEERATLIARRDKIKEVRAIAICSEADRTLRSAADSTSIAFSLAFSPSIATMHVHWREEWENGVEYWHAHVVDTYAMRIALEPYERLGMHMTNIMNWGCTTRRTEIEKQAQVIAERKYPGIDPDEVTFEPIKQQRAS